MSVLSPRVLLPYVSRLAPLVHDEHMERGWKSLALEMPRLNDEILACGLHVILVTASDDPDMRTHTLALGATAFFQKPTRFAAYMELGRLI
jgi:hypothetical protein